MRADARRNRERILAAARELFAGEDPEVQISDVAHHAGVGVGTVYRHFPDKEALMGELVRERFTMFNAGMREALAAPSDHPFAQLTGTLRANVALVADDAATRFAFMRGGERVFAHAESELGEFRVLVTQLIERAHGRGLRPDFRAEDVPMIMCGACATIGKTDGGWDWNRHLDLIIDGMRARS
jgi:AcrR family transcriptional regulator